MNGHWAIAELWGVGGYRVPLVALGRLLVVVGMVVGCGATETTAPGDDELCSDGELSGEETDLDCGGPTCAACSDGQPCLTPDDCQSGVCQAGRCAAPACTDGSRNGTETDTDCGGRVCLACDAASQCLVPEDCLDRNCVDGRCVAATCTDGVYNGTETDIDCGSEACAGCGSGDECLENGDCGSNHCIVLTVAPGVCLAPCGTDDDCPTELVCASEGSCRDPCQSDDGCVGSSEFCTAEDSRCRTYSLEGGLCGGLTVPPNVFKCADGLVCQGMNPLMVHELGVCLGTCSIDDDCNGEQVCATNGTCRDPCPDDDGCVAWLEYCTPEDGRCRKYSNTGGSCGGFTFPPNAYMCADGLVCQDMNPLLADEPGVCLDTCSTDDDCNGEQVCATNGTCRDPCLDDDGCILYLEYCTPNDGRCRE